MSRIIADIGKSTPGSFVVYTYLRRLVIECRSDTPGAGSMKARLLLLFGLEPTEMQDFLGRFDLTLVKDIGTD